MQWFKHDIGAFKDERIQALRIDCGGAAVDVYYAILELIYEREADLVMDRNQAETKSVLHWLCVGWAGFCEYARAMRDEGLLTVEFDADGDNCTSITLSSMRASETISNMDRKRETARQNGKGGGRPPKRKPNGTEQKPTLVFSGTDAPLDNKTLRHIEKDVSKDTSKKGDGDSAAIAEIVAYLNAAVGRSYKPTTPKTRSLVKARMREGFTVADFKTVIDKKAKAWLGTEFAQYLRPETLFGTKFEGYLNEITKEAGKDARFDKYR